MRRKLPLFKISLAVAALLAIVVFAIHFYVTRQIEGELATIASQVAPMGSLEWDSVRIHPSGQIHIRELRFAPHMVAGELKIGQLAFIAPNLVELLLASREFDRGRLPQSLGLSIRAMQVPIEGSGMERMEIPFSTGLPYEAAGCKQRELLFIGDLPNLDIWNLTTDLTLDYRLLGNGESMTLRVSSHTQYLAGLSLDARLYLGSASRDVDLLARAWSMARLEQLHLNYRNLGFRDRLDRFCADLLDLSPEGFRERHLGAWVAAWGRTGLAPGSELVEAYRRFINDPQAIELSIQPEQPLPLTAFTRLSREQLLDEFDLSLKVNHGSSSIVGFDIVPVHAPVIEPGDDDAVAEEDSGAQPRQRGWVDTPVAGLAGREGERIRLTTSTGERISGELIEVDASYIHLRIRGVGGFHVRPFPRQRIASVEVRD